MPRQLIYASVISPGVQGETPCCALALLKTVQAVQQHAQLASRAGVLNV